MQEETRIGRTGRLNLPQGLSLSPLCHHARNSATLEQWGLEQTIISWFP
jgi:hypothetical protein